MSRKKEKVCYIKPEEPKFLKEIKQKIGYKEGPTINDKRRPEFEENEDESASDERKKDEDQPQIVVLKEGDLSEKEFKAILKEAEEKEDS